MSDGYAMAAITAVLRGRLNARLVASDVGAVVGQFTVTSTPPDLIRPAQGNDPTQLNLFLHQVTPNATYRNSDQPTRAASGRASRKPALVVDLHYLMSAYGAQPLFPEVLLGHAALLLHQEPVLTRDHIRASLVPPIPAPIAASGIDEQVELIRISPEAISSEEMSRMWSALDAQYRPSMAYKVSVAFIESDLSPGAALPAMRRTFTVLPTLGAQLSKVSAEGTEAVTLTMVDIAEIIGTGLNTQGLALRFGEISHTPTPAQIRPSGISLPLGDLATPPLPGLVPLRAVISPALGIPPVPHAALTSNTVAMPLAATFAHVLTPATEQIVDGVTYRTGTLDLTTTPAIGARQTVTLSLNELGSPPGSVARQYTFNAPRDNGVVAPAQTTTAISIAYTDVAAGDYLLRLRVDGVDSPLSADGNGVFNGPQVTI